MSLEYAKLLYDQQKQEKAYPILKDYLATNGEHFEALLFMVFICLDLDKIKEAESYNQEILRLSPGGAIGVNNLGMIAYQKDEYSKALKHVEEAISIDPFMLYPRILKARLLLIKSRYAEAEIAYLELLEMEPENIEVMNILSRVLHMQNKYKESEEIVNRILSKDPNNSVTFSNLGFVILEKGKYKKAMEYFGKSLEINPNLESAKEGMKISMKAKFPLYRWLVQFQFFMDKLSPNTQFAIIIGLVVFMQLLSRNTFFQSGFMSYFKSILLGILVIFVVSSWILNPIMNFVLYTNKMSRLSLSKEEINISKMVRISGIIFVLGLLLMIGNYQLGIYIAIVSICSLFYSNRLFSEREELKQREVNFFIIFLICSIFGLLLTMANGDESAIYFPLIVTVIYTFLGNTALSRFIHSKRNS